MKRLVTRQQMTFADWCAEVRELADEQWPEVSDQCPTLYAVWGGGATPHQALHMIGLILPPRQYVPANDMGAQRTFIASLLAVAA